MTPDLQLLRRLYKPDDLTDLGEKLAAQLAELSSRPSLDRCDAMVRELAEATTTVHRLRSQLRGAHG